MSVDVERPAPLGREQWDGDLDPLETGNPLVFPKETEPFFAESDLRMCARFVDGPIDHIRAPSAYEYPAGSRGSMSVEP